MNVATLINNLRNNDSKLKLINKIQKVNMCMYRIGLIDPLDSRYF